MNAIILAGLQRAALGLMGSILTEKLFMKVLARIAVAIIKKIVESTETTIDNEAAGPLIERLKKHY